MASLEEVVRIRCETTQATRDIRKITKGVEQAGSKAGSKIVSSLGGGIKGLLGKANVGAFALSALQGAASGAASGIAATSGLESAETARFRAGVGAKAGLVDATIGNIPIIGQPLAEIIKFEDRKNRAVGETAEASALSRVAAEAQGLAASGVSVSDAEIRESLRIARQRSIREADITRRVNEQADYAGTIISANRYSANSRQ